MVLGFLLYEAVDVAYHATKITFNGIAFVYNWYYGINIRNLDYKVKDDEQHIKLLEDRVKQLEQLLDISNNIQKQEEQKQEEQKQEEQTIKYCDSI